jgi:hypothetical protein
MGVAEGVTEGVPLGVDETLEPPTRVLRAEERGVMFVASRGRVGVVASSWWVGAATARRGAEGLFALRRGRPGWEAGVGVEGARASLGVRGVLAVRLLASVGFRGRGLLRVLRSMGILLG